MSLGALISGFKLQKTLCNRHRIWIKIRTDTLSDIPHLSFFMGINRGSGSAYKIPL